MKQNTLPGMSFKETNDQKSREYISNLYKKPVYQLHKAFFKNYLFSGYGVILSHIKKSYIKYVCSNEWTKEKYDEVLYVLISNEQTLSNNAFENMGKEYDTGAIKMQKGFADFRNNKNKHDFSDMNNDELLKFLNNHN